MTTAQNVLISERLTAVRAQFDKWDVDGVLITHPANRRWLSGFTGSAGSLLLTAEDAWIFTDFRYWEQAESQAPAFALVQDRRQVEDKEKLFAPVSGMRLGREAGHVTLSAAAKLDEFAEVSWVNLAQTVEPLRAQKSAAEVEAIRAAAALTDAAMAGAPQILRPGVTEKEAAWRLEKEMREAGASGMAFTVIVAAGANSALPHYRPGERPLRPGDPIIVDMGAELDGYKSDLTRTFFLGETPSAQFMRVYELVLAAQTAVFREARPGMTGKEVDALARDVIAAAGHEDDFGHGLGHGVGLEIHEAPRLSRLAEKSKVKEGMVATVEPGVYLPGWGGVRIEDLAYLTPAGLERLSQAPKTPAIPI